MQRLIMVLSQKFRLFPLFLQTLILLVIAPAAFGQAAPPKEPTMKDFGLFLQAKLKQVDELADLDVPTKAKVRDLYLQSLTELNGVQRFSESAARFEQQAIGAPKEIENTKTALAAMSSQTVAVPPMDATLQQVELKISNKTADLEKARKDLADDEAEVKGQAAKRTKLTEMIAKLREQQDAIKLQLAVPAAIDENPAAKAVNFAARMVLVTQRRRIEQEIVAHEKELTAVDARADLLPLQHDLHAKKADLLDQELSLWQAVANRRRQNDADQQTQQALQEVKYANPLTQELVKDNAKLAANRKALAVSIAEVTGRLKVVNQNLADIQKSFQEIKEKTDRAEKTNVTSAIGLFLRQKRDQLPNLHEYARDIDIRRQTQGDAELQLLTYTNQRLQLSNLDQQVAAFLEKTAKEQNAAWSTVDQAALGASVRGILTDKIQYLNNLNDDYKSYTSQLALLIVAEKKLMAQTDDCAQFIDQRVLWIASSAPVGTIDLEHANQAICWLAGPSAWAELGTTLASDAVKNPILYTLAIVICIALFYWRFRFHAKIVEIGEMAARGNCCRFWPTLETTILTFLVAIGWPGLTQFLGMRLTAAAEDSVLCLAVGHGLTETARVFLALELLRIACCPKGLGESHFHWTAGATKLLRSNIRWFISPGLILMGVAVTMAWQNNNDWDTSLGRLSFVIALLCFSLALYRVFRPSSAIVQAMIAARRDGWLERFRYVWYPLCVSMPASLALMAILGYHYTSRQLVIRLILTAYIIVGGFVCRALLLRWVLVNQRRLAIEQNKKRRAAQADTKISAGDDKIPTPADADRDLAVINVQTKRFIEYGLSIAASLLIWCAWCDVMPALDGINVQVWTIDADNAPSADASSTASNDASATPAAAAIAAASPATTASPAATTTATSDSDSTNAAKHGRQIRLVNLFLAFIIFITTAIAAKNIPGLLEMVVLQHLPVDAGARYASATVSRYVISIAGMLWTCSLLGIGWSKVQWLIAAMGLGLGFGLQEIFANFMSGLIILFERPIRVGDVVTIGTVTGVVSRIHMRATTIVDADRKELIIPNKEFITGQVLNWTLTDPVNRVVINVGVAYGSDTALVARTLEHVARENPIVLDDPAPFVSLDSFGDSALNFVLRCYLPDLNSRLTVINDLNMAIEREFAKAGVEMPFPQHDIHVRSIDAITPGLQALINEGPAGWADARHPKAVERAA